MQSTCSFRVFFILFFFPLLLSGNNSTDHDSIRSVESYRAAILLSGNQRYADALDSFLVSLNVWKKILSPENRNRLASRYNAIAVTYKNLGFHNQAIEYSKLAEQAYIEAFGENNRYLSGVYSNLGNVYKNKLNYDEALRYFIQMIQVQMNQDELYKEDLAELNYNLAELYFRMYKYEDAEKIIVNYLEQADPVTKIKYLDLMGGIRLEQNNTSEAVTWYDKAVKLAEQNFTVDDMQLASQYLNYATCLIRNENQEEAFPVLDKAFKIITLTQKDLGVNLAEYYLILGNLVSKRPVSTADMKSFLEQKQKNLGESIQLTIKALEALNFPSGEISADNLRNVFLLSETRCMDYLKLIADKYIELSQLINNEKDELYLKNILKGINYYRLTGELIQRAKKEMSGDEGKILLAELESSAYLKMIQACFKVWDITHDEEYFELAFRNAEQLKSGTIFDKLSDQFARENSLIPDSLIMKEKLINSRITAYSELKFNESRNQNPSQQVIANADSMIFLLKRERTVLNDFLANRFPDYYELKYAETTPGLEIIRSKLKNNEVLIEYILYENDSITELYTFVLDKEQLHFTRQETNQVFKDELENYFSFLADSRFMFTKNEDSKRFCIASHFLYKSLIQPFEPMIAGKNVVVVPDGKLNYIPFDGLIKTLPDTAGFIRFKDLDYMIKSHVINYTYSASLKYGLTHQKGKSQKKVMAFAPVYQTETVNFDEGQLHLTPLPGTKMEVESISGKISTELFIDKEATEMNFRLNAEKYGILHLAMHAFINDSLPAFSRFVFSQTGDKETNSDGFLNTADIYTMNLNARLTVLSACNTGSGTLKKGEGVMSLARGFLYAGCPTIIMTLWEVEDLSGAEMMSSFYSYLKKGKPTDEALRHAKLDYLDHANPRHSHPRYWLGYVSIGENTPVFKGYDFYFFSLLLLILIAAISEQIIRIRKNRRMRNKPEQLNRRE